MKIRNLSCIIILLVALIVTLNFFSRINDIYLYSVFLVLICTPFILIGYIALTKKYRGERVFFSLLIAVSGSFLILYTHYYLQGTPLNWGLPLSNEVNKITADQLLFTTMVRINLVLTIVYGIYFSVASFRKK